ncbi:VWFA domain-containing protein [Trichostrongylus colubriformis]|uniref:Midasin n=1 Tax=Trichostrongylus colubriformis TaxID=6319 RepID=A0AAN8FCQ6_TRICO
MNGSDLKRKRRKAKEITLLPTRESAACQLIAALHGKHFVVVEGPIGSGKTFLASHAAKELRLPLKTMQMGDQLDSKGLFGSYHCTEVAGQFLWKPSSFSEWLQERCVILLEDIDLSNSDVISTVIQLVSKRSTMLPCGVEISLHEDVRIMATISGKGKRSSLLDGIPVRVKLDQLTDEELKRLITKESPRIAHLAKTLISIFRSLECVPPTSNSRQLTSSDLLRGCARVSKLSDLSQNIAIFTELVDCWCLSDLPGRAMKLCEKVAAPLSVTGDQICFHLFLRQPTFSHDDRWCTIGRCRLPSSPTLHSAHAHRLGHTRDVLQLMERLAVCVQNREPVLLVGETGVGKTSIVQCLASAVNTVLKVVNLSPSSDTDELISGYKPTTISHILTPFTRFYHEVFTSTFDVTKNQKFLSHLEACLSTGRYRDYLSVAIATAEKALLKQTKKKDPRWASVIVRGRRIRESLENGAAFFAITRGAVLEAAQEGHWLLIDEINLAPPESLDAIVHAILGKVHPNFRLFACMNPATDAGKRRLPASVRTRFTEFYVPEMTDPHQLALVVSAYLPSMKSASVSTLVNFYLQAKQLYPMSYSLRTLCRALVFASENMFASEDRSLYEALCMAFLTNLDAEAKEKMRIKIAQTFRAATSVSVRPPSGNSEDYVLVEGYWIERGTELPREDRNYIVTKTVKQNLAEIARITSSGRFPILLEGETSSGKTSIVFHLARITGNAVVRINNHEHTDVQEYMGSYVGDSSGRLVFREGALVKAVRNGSWIILDELNLAPTDIIEALNRLLDDNRELYITETNAVVKAHPRFRLFATQNPAGSYGGRKRLSRALMSRFVVLRFSNIPLDELASMVCVRCGIHESAALRMISVLSKLRVKRSITGVFSAKDGLMTLRDLFKWARRLSTDSSCDDWLQVLANHGYFLLAGRCRNQKDVASVVETLESELKRKINPSELFAMNSPYMPKDVDVSGIVMTLGMRRMLVMTEQAWLRNEAVLMVGETGGGKTSLAHAVGRGTLLTINCHERTETADLLGRLRPRDNGGFAWADGVVISAMRSGVPLLIDEISLAEDSVLERLNPLFEDDRTLLLSDAGVEVHPVSAGDGFQIIATMNPGGDYGKKELSKALRNRFTEVWSSCDYEGSELLAIFNSRLSNKIHKDVIPSVISPAEVVINWIAEFFKKYMHIFRHSPSVRDVVACAEIYSACVVNGLPQYAAIYEAISAVFLDALNGQQMRIVVAVDVVRSDAELLLQRLSHGNFTVMPPPSEVHISACDITIGALSIPFGPLLPELPSSFSLRAPTCIANFYRIARGLLINKPILLEGAPGCGKSSTVMALAMLTGHPITRLNLSDQTDLSDLFGSDVPIVTDDGHISFRWEDGPILRAIKRGEWVLLDEMNLASQAVLEGLNACFDHRRVLYIAELNRSFEIPPGSNCRFFACQNPRAQGGNRRALPKSFVNRFTSIYVDDLRDEDVLLILGEYPPATRIDNVRLKAMVAVNSELASEQSMMGGPFSFNLRDLLRWIQLFDKNNDMATCFQLLYMSRMRREEDREKLRLLFSQHFGESCVAHPVVLSADKERFQIGQVSLHRKGSMDTKSLRRLLASQITLMHQLSVCVAMQWMPLIIGARNCGKRSTLENLAEMCGVKLHTIVLTSETDAQELIGSYEQVVDGSILIDAKANLCELLRDHVDAALLKKLNAAEDVIQLETMAEMVLIGMTGSHSIVVDECREVLAHAARSAMRFEWIDSPFVRAYLDGNWLLIEDVNLCSAAVLDRLNSCLESDGRLVISERQSSFKPLKPHPNFRVFLSMDPRNGEISRAMRNRSVEIFVTSQQQWNANPPDIAAVVYSHGKPISTKLAEALSSLSAEKQLHFSALLSEMPLEEACRVVGLSYFEHAQLELQNCSIAPLVKEIDTDRYDSWLLGLWKNCSDSDNSSGLFLALLSTSTHVLRGALFHKIFGDCAVPAVNRLREVTQKVELSNHPFDPRFHNGIPKPEYQETVKSFVIVTVCEWFSCFLKSVTVCSESAEYLSRSLSKFQMTRLDVSFKNLSLIAGVVDAVMEALKNASHVVEENEVFMFCLHLALFVIASRRPLDARTGCAPLYLAWNEIHRLLSRPTVIDGDATKSHPSGLSKLIHLMGEGWSVDAHDRFINSYLPFYETYRVAEPFCNEEENQRLCSTLCSVRVDVDSHDVSHSQFLNGDSEELNSAVHTESPISKTLNLISLFRRIHTFFSTGVIDKSCRIFDNLAALETVRWRNERYRKFAQGTALLNIEYSGSKKIASLRFSDAFSTAFLSLWEDVDYDPQLNSLSVSHLMHCEMLNIQRQLWRLAPNSFILSQLITKELQSANKGLTGWLDAMDTTHVGWKKRLDVALEIMQNALPPPDTLDPVIFGEERTAYQLSVFRATDQPLTTLAKWRNAVSRQSGECDSRSLHPVIANLWNTRSELTKLVEKLGEKPIVFRQKASQYSTMCDEIRAFFNVVARIVPVLNELHSDADTLWADFDSRQLSVALAQLRSFEISARGFKKRILSLFGSFVDVSMTFIQGLDIFLCGLHEACDLIEIAERRRDLHNSTAFPTKFNIKTSSEGLESPELLSWCCRDVSPMPLRLKAAVVKCRLSSAEESIFNLQWIRHQWQKWYERNIAKAAEKDFVYRSRTQEEKDELDMMEFFSEYEQEREILPDSTLGSLLEWAYSEAPNIRCHKDSDYVLALLWLRHVLAGVRHFDESFHPSIVDSDLSLLEDLVAKISTDSDTVLDVYRSASLAQFRRAAEILEPLAKRTKVIRERWPEQVSLSLILEAIKTFSNAKLSTTHMKMSVLIEDIIEQCEEWEKMADKANTLRQELAPLRALLVDWKKMEVRSWGDLLRRVEKDGHLRAQLVAFPLFDALFKAETPEAHTALLAMSTEWIGNATLLDYSTRIKSIHCLAEWAEVLGHPAVSLQLHSVGAHFEQYVPLVEQSLREAREPAEHALRDYVKIVKFNDLNLWNIKVSSQKAHTHLFKIVRKFREAVGVQVLPIFDRLVEIDNASAAAAPDLLEVKADGRGQRAKELADVILTQASTICDVSAAVELADQARCCDEAIRVPINYQGEDVEKEKQQGYARNSRQRAVAMVIKEGQSIGLNARKAQVLDQEALTRASLTEVKRNCANETSVHKCAGGRSACIRRAIAPNDQVGVATRKHLTGVIDYGMAWILKCHRKLADWEESCNVLSRKTRAFERLESNVQDGWFVNYGQMKSQFKFIHTQVEELVRWTDAMSKRLSLVPEQQGSNEEESADWEHPLSRLHSQSPELEILQKFVNESRSLSKKMYETTNPLMAESGVEIYEKLTVTRSLEHLSSDGAELKDVLRELHKWFEYECARADESLEKMLMILKVDHIGIKAVAVSTDCALLFVQNLYKAVVDNANTSDMRLMDRFDFALNAITASGYEKVVAWASQTLSDACVGLVPESMNEITSLLRIVTHLFSAMNRLVSSALQAFTSLYYVLLSMSMQLFEKGYVNPIPKAEKQESGQGNADDVGEGGGMGEGEAKSDAKDVTDEMEESGQIEGLQDDECEPPTGDAGQNEKPIEMEEDFPEEMQDIDRNEAGEEEEKSGGDSEEEPEPEDQMGDVDEADDQQLDPKLWDEEEKDESRKETDEDNAAADNKTDELAAKEDDTVAADEKSGENEKEEESNEQQADDVENVDERDRDDEKMDTGKEDPLLPENDVEDSQGAEDLEKMDHDSTDDEQENDVGEAAGEEEKDGEEDETTEETESAKNPPNDQETENEMDTVEATEQGTGGEQAKNEQKEQNGGSKEDQSEENKDERKGESKSDERGEEGKGNVVKANEDDKENEENERDPAEGEESTEKQREVAQESDNVEDKGEGEGEQDETATQMQDAPDAERQMLGAGSLEEAKQSRKDPDAKVTKEHKKIQKGAQESADAPIEHDTTAADECQATIHLAPEQMFNLAEELSKELTVGALEDKQTTESLKHADSDKRDLVEAEQMWATMVHTVGILAAELAENLRLILEPQRANKMQGDYRTGKRLNMRRLIPYIASEYRKDRIWMRRTKKAQRDYQVLIAVDDSASMNENGIHQMTCESVCIVEDALRRCDAGGVSVCSFGSEVKMINAFGDHMMPGPELLQKLSFAQSSTDLLLLLDRSRHLLSDVRTPTSEQLLIIISDGRGALAQGPDKVKAALASLQGVTVLFVILDCGPKSICDLSVATFKDGDVILTPYLTTFPFPFYAIVKSVTHLPSVLADSIRQWFEMTVQTNSV